MTNEAVERGDFVSVEGETGDWRVIASQDGEPHWRATDGSQTRWVRSDQMKLLRKSAKPLSSSVFDPDDWDI